MTGETLGIIIKNHELKIADKYDLKDIFLINRNN